MPHFAPPSSYIEDGSPVLPAGFLINSVLNVPGIGTAFALTFQKFVESADDEKCLEQIS